jgi:hypothetical protein
VCLEGDTEEARAVKRDDAGKRDQLKAAQNSSKSPFTPWCGPPLRNKGVSSGSDHVPSWLKSTTVE